MKSARISIAVAATLAAARSKFTYALWDQFRDRQQAFSSVFAWAQHRFNTSAGGEVRDVEGLYVSGDFFKTLGVVPAIGRVFSTDDDRPGCGSSGAVLGYSYWQREYGAQPSAYRANVLKLIGGECGKLLIAGLLLGTGLALAASQAAIGKLLYGLSPNDLLTIVLSVLLLALVALPASLIPAIRASRLDPMNALREE